MAVESAHPRAVAATRALFAVGAAWWMTLSALLWFGVVSIGQLDRITLAVVAGLMLADGIAMAVLAGVTFRGRRWVDYLAVVLVLANLVATVTDEVGVPDLVYLGYITALLVVLLLGMRKARAPVV